MAAIFWQAQPLPLYSGVMRDLSARYGLSTADNARLFGMVTLAAADAAIVCWNDKYTRQFWRPIDAIRLADTDGNRGRRPTRTGGRCSTRPRRPRRRWRRRTSPTTRPATAA